jgi:cytochrome c oxidase assembly protein subunit 15
MACLVVALITAGALVTSKGAGLSVPDWPLSYGTLNPPNWWRISTVRAEHGHRLFAGTVALLTLGLAIAVARVEPRHWVRRLAWLALLAVLCQALLGGLTVLFFLPTAISVAHAGLAEIFLCLIVSVAVVTAPSWRALSVRSGVNHSGAPRLWTLAMATTGAVYVQILLGAIMRHTGAGLAIPDFPLVFGGLLPPQFDFQIAIHFAHRVWALAVAGLIFWTAGRTLRSHRGTRLLVRPALILDVLVLVQIGLGGAVILSHRSVPINTAHVATGATILALTLTLTLRAWRLERRDGPESRSVVRAESADRAAS